MRAAPIVAVCVTAILFASLAGCSGQGNQQIDKLTPAQVSQMIIRGQTTEAEVKAELGDPLKVTFTDSGNQQWEYDYTKLHLTATDFMPVINLLETNVRGTKKTLVILFDRRGVVRNYSLTCSRVYQHRGIMN